MEIVQPIRDLEIIQQFKDELLKSSYTLDYIGITQDEIDAHMDNFHL